MTKLLEQALTEASKLSDKEQNAIAADILAKVKASEQETQAVSDLADEPFFGIWRDREDLQDSTAWVRDLRKQEWSH